MFITITIDKDTNDRVCINTHYIRTIEATAIVGDSPDFGETEGVTITMADNTEYVVDYPLGSFAAKIGAHEIN